jgi:hypothetical protein
MVAAIHFIRATPSRTTPFNTFTLLSTTLFAGIVFCRSLHYSFYIWYFHLIPFLLRLAGLSIPVRVLVALALEWAWNQWQGYKAHDEFNSCATWWGSSGMFAVHIFILWRLWGLNGVQKGEKGRVLG